MQWTQGMKSSVEWSVHVLVTILKQKLFSLNQQERKRLLIPHTMLNFLYSGREKGAELQDVKI